MSLTQTAYMTRNLIKYGGVSLVALVLLWSIGSVSIKIYKAANPVYVAPTVQFGMLPKNVFPTKEFITKKFSFEFTDDLTPSFGDRGKVYVIYRSTVEILAFDEATSVAKEFGFENDPVVVGKGIYEFKNDKNKTLTMDVFKGDFSLKYSYADDSSVLNAENMPTKDIAIKTAESFLEAGGKYTDDLKKGEKEASYWKIADGTLTAVSTQSEANAIKVNFYKQLLDDKWKIVSPQNGETSVSILISGSTDSDKKVIEANFKYVNIGRESFSTYPIKTSAEAMADLEAGNYWPASDISNESVIIRDMQLAYYEPVILTQYLQPIYVFKGDNNFVAYVSAVTSNYVSD